MAEDNAAAAEPVIDYSNVDYGSMPLAIRVSERLRLFVDMVGRWGSWLIVPTILITVWDVTVRKLVWIQLWLMEYGGRIFESTMLQELEWHFHTGLFALVLGYGYIWNTHVRVDLVREHLKFRRKVWLEFLGVTFFLIPYCACVIYFASIYAYDSWVVGEISASTVGLTHRWIIKSVLVFGLILAALAGIAVWLQVVFILVRGDDVRFRLIALDWPEEEGTKIEGKERLDLSKAEDQLEVRARASGHLTDDKYSGKDD